MSHITLVRQQDTQIAEADKMAARNVLFGVVDGLGDIERKKWRRFFSQLMRLEPGEMLEIRTHKARLGWYHRKHMALETKVFEAQERFADFKQFRLWLKVGSGFVDWCAGPKGGVFPVPKSISYDRIEQQDMEEVHDNIVTFLRTPHAIKYLWPKLPDEQRDLAIEAVLLTFDE
jgi:hypothetical protein